MPSRNHRRTATALALALSFAGTLWRLGAAAPQATRPDPPLSPEVYVPGPPQYVAGPTVLQAGFSPNGRYILLVMTDPESPEDEAARKAEWKPGIGPEPGVSTLHLVLWNRRTHRAAATWTAPWKTARFQRMEWLPGSDTVLASVASRDRADQPNMYSSDSNLHLIQMDPRRGTAVERTSVWNGPNSTFLVSPRLPVAVVISGGEDPRELRVVRANSVSEDIPLPVGTYSFDVRWSADGATFYLPFHGPYDKETPEEPVSWQALDTRKATLKSVPHPPESATRLTLPKVKPPPFTVMTKPVSVKDGRHAFTTCPLWLDNGGGSVPARFLLHANAREPSVSPAHDAVLYLADGMAFLRPLRREARMVYEGRTARAIQALAETNARQVAHALQFYSADYLDTLPPRDLMKDAVDPFLPSRDVWEAGTGTGYGFVYAPPGSPVPADQRATTPMGYYPAPGGRYTVYMDGRIAWEPAPASGGARPEDR